MGRSRFCLATDPNRICPRIKRGELVSRLLESPIPVGWTGCFPVGSWCAFQKAGQVGHDLTGGLAVPYHLVRDAMDSGGSRWNRHFRANPGMKLRQVGARCKPDRGQFHNSVFLHIHAGGFPVENDQRASQFQVVKFVLRVFRWFSPWLEFEFFESAGFCCSVFFACCCCNHLRAINSASSRSRRSSAVSWSEIGFPFWEGRKKSRPVGQQEMVKSEEYG